MDRVLHIITHLGVGGAQDNTLLTVKGLSRNRYRVHLMAGRDYTEWEERGREAADAYFPLPFLCRAARPLHDCRALQLITAHIVKQSYTIVHTHSSKAGILGRLAAHRAGVPLIVHTIHGFPWHDYMSPPKRWFYLSLERYAASFSDGLITVSERNRKKAISLGLAPPEKLTTIYSGINLTKFEVMADRAEKCRELGLDPTRAVVGTVGRLSPQKAPLDFVQVARHVLRARPGVQFVMVGDGPLAEEVRRAVGGERRIKVTGYRADVPEILSLMDVFVLPSLWEGLGRALTEAMIMARPVAATAVEGVPELVVHGETGLLSRPGRPADLAENVLWLLDHPGEAGEMGRRARERVVPAFSAELMVERIEELYERLLAGKAGR